MGMLTISTVEFGEHPNLSSPWNQPAGHPWWQMAAASSISSNFLVVETAPNTNISDISDIRRPRLFCLRTSNLLLPGFLRKLRFFVPVQCQIGCCRTFLMTLFFSNSYSKECQFLCKKWSRFYSTFVCFFLGWVMGYDPKSSSPDHFPVVSSLKEMRQLKEVNFRWADDQQFGALKKIISKKLEAWHVLVHVGGGQDPVNSGQISKSSFYERNPVNLHDFHCEPVFTQAYFVLVHHDPIELGLFQKHKKSKKIGALWLVYTKHLWNIISFKPVFFSWSPCFLFGITGGSSLLFWGERRTRHKLFTTKQALRPYNLVTRLARNLQEYPAEEVSRFFWQNLLGRSWMLAPKKLPQKQKLRRSIFFVEKHWMCFFGVGRIVIINCVACFGGSWNMQVLSGPILLHHPDPFKAVDFLQHLTVREPSFQGLGWGRNIYWNIRLRYIDGISRTNTTLHQATILKEFCYMIFSRNEVSCLICLTTNLFKSYRNEPKPLIPINPLRWIKFA